MLSARCLSDAFMLLDVVMAAYAVAAAPASSTTIRITYQYDVLVGLCVLFITDKDKHRY